MTDLTVNLSKVIQAPIEKVFDAWLDAETLAKFMLPAPGMPTPEVITDARPGGRFSIIMHVGDEKIPHTGEYLEIIRPDKLVFTWESPCSVDQSTVTLKFAAITPVSTEMELTHVRFIDEDTRADHDRGWTNILDAQAELMVMVD